MQRRRKNKLDNMAGGVIIGFALPVIIFFAVYYFSNSTVPFPEYVNNLLFMQAFIKLGSLCVFANSAVFMLFIKLQYDKTARGILGATIIYALVVMVARIY